MDLSSAKALLPFRLPTNNTSRVSDDRTAALCRHSVKHLVSCPHADVEPMKFYNLKSMIASRKNLIALSSQTESFGMTQDRPDPYIEPTFRQIEVSQQRAAVLLVSAVGATGKTTLAKALSKDTGLPLLDLAKHKPVGADTVTGLLTNAFHVRDLTRVFESISAGEFGIIVDGVDEGRSKTTEGAFEAFLDDVARLCRSAAAPSFVLLGRTQALDDCWVYLVDRGVPLGLLTIEPFDESQAKRYIDEFTHGTGSPHADEYCQARDMILEALGAVFTHNTPQESQGFLSFIGYPPVLDAVATLLAEEKNYYKLRNELASGRGRGVEVGLLQRIAEYILRREKQEKVARNILQELVREMPEEEQKALLTRAYEGEEQCLRLTSLCLGHPLEVNLSGEPAIDAEYEKSLRSFLPEHPFVAAAPTRFRNAVFEAVALSTLILSANPTAVELALEYVDAHKHNYHLLYLLHSLARGRRVPIAALRAIIGSALEFRSRVASVQITVGDPDEEDWDWGQDSTVPIDIEILMGADQGESEHFLFESDVQSADTVNVGDRLSSTSIVVPCTVLMLGQQEVELTAPTAVFARRVEISSREVVLKTPADASPEERLVLLVGDTFQCAATRIVADGADFVIAVGDRTGVTYPAVRYVQEMPSFRSDASLKEKYLRLRRILVHFRSHKRGTMAKCRAKIEHERVLRNSTGRAILQRLLVDGILTRDGDFYFLQPGSVDKHLGISYVDLQRGATSEKLEEYLASIP